jgi:hypothetical protein
MGCSTMPSIYEVFSEYLHVHCHVHQLGVAIVLMPLEQKCSL